MPAESVPASSKGWQRHQGKSTLPLRRESRDRGKPDEEGDGDSDNFPNGFVRGNGHAEKSS